VNQMLDDPATLTRHREYLVDIVTDGLNEAWPDREKALLDHGEWKRFGRPTSLSPGFPFPSPPRHPPARITRLQRLAADRATPARLRVTAAAAILPTAAGVEALDLLARDPDLRSRHRRRAMIAIAEWDPGAARPLVAEAVHHGWLARAATWQLLITLFRLPPAAGADPMGGPECETLRRRIDTVLDGTRFVMPLRLARLLLVRPALDPPRSGNGAVTNPRLPTVRARD